MKRWPIKPLGEAAEVFNGKTPAKTEQRSAGHPVLKIKDVDENGNFRGSFESFVDTSFAETHAKKKVNVADVLILNAAHNADYVASKVFYADSQVSGVLATGEWLIVRANPVFILPGFVHHWVHSQIGRASIKNLVRGIHLYPSDVASVQLPVPPLAEQERIVKLLDEADELRKLRAQADRHSANLIPALFHEMFGDPAKNTSRWMSLPLGEVVRFGSGATPSKENPEFWNGQIPWVSPKDMKADEITDSEDHVSAEAFEKTNLQLIPKDTILIVVRGMILAHTVPIRRCRVPVAINQDMKALLPRMPIETEFLRWTLQSQHAHMLNQVSTAGHGTKKLDSEKLRAVMIPVPPLPLQQEFAQRVGEIRALQAAQAASRQRTEHLFQSMLHRAFNQAL